MEEKYKEQLNREQSWGREEEKLTTLDAEIKAGEWQTLKRFKAYRQRSRQGKILATYEAVSNRLRQLESVYYRLVRDNPKKSAKLLNDIKQLRLVQDILLQCLSWPGAGEDEANDMEEIMPRELFELIA